MEHRATRPKILPVSGKHNHGLCNGRLSIEDLVMPENTEDSENIYRNSRDRYTGCEESVGDSSASFHSSNISSHDTWIENDCDKNRSKPLVPIRTAPCDERDMPIQSDDMSSDHQCLSVQNEMWSRIPGYLDMSSTSTQSSFEYDASLIKMVALAFEGEVSSDLSIYLVLPLKVISF